MKLESQLVNKELSQRIKELGVKQESLWWWLKTEEPTHTSWDIRGNKFREDFLSCARRLFAISAFTVAELGEMLPEKYRTIKKYNASSGKMQWSCYDPNGEGFVETISNTEANSRAKCLIYLIENKKI